MDSDDLDVLYEQIHERFGVEIDSCLAGAETLGGLYNYILWKLGLVKYEEACLSPPTFFVLRQVLAERAGKDAKSISLDTHLSDLLPWRRRRCMWRELSETLDLKFPQLRDNPAMTGGAALIFLSIQFPLTVIFLSHEFSSAVTAVTALSMYVVILVAVLLCLMRLGRLVQFRLPCACRTVGQLVEYLVAINPSRLRERFETKSLEKDTTPAKTTRPHCRCTYLPTFLHIRKALVEVTDPYPMPIQPETSLAHVLDEYPRRKTWRALERSLGWKLPDLRRSWVVIGLCVAGYFAVAWMAFREYGSLWLATLFVIPYAIIAQLFTRPLAVHLPLGFETVGDLAKAVVNLNYGRVAAEYDSVNADEVWTVLRDLVAEVLDLRPEDVEPDMPLVGYTPATKT